MRRIRSHLTYANVMVTLLAFVVLAGGAAYAANTIFSSDIVNGEVKTADIGNDQVRSADVRDDTLANGGLGSVDIAPDSFQGADIVEGHAAQNVDAATVGGVQVRKINFQVGTGTGPTTVLNFGGLRDHRRVPELRRHPRRKGFHIEGQRDRSLLRWQYNGFQ